MPAAMTATSTSSGPIAGVSISSIWNAVIGAPRRSWRITDATIRAGTSPTGGSAGRQLDVDIGSAGLLARRRGRGTPAARYKRTGPPGGDHGAARLASGAEVLPPWRARRALPDLPAERRGGCPARAAAAPAAQRDRHPPAQQPQLAPPGGAPRGARAGRRLSLRARPRPAG